MGLLPEIPQALYDAAAVDRMSFGMQLMAFAQSGAPRYEIHAFHLGKTLGKALGSVNLAALWGLLQVAPNSFRECAARAGFNPGPAMGKILFKAVLDHPQGICIGSATL